ncbi:MAG: hypothetical protein AB2L14_22805 [Candidatus Xenobiia bacterium LiM19]
MTFAYIMAFTVRKEIIFHADVNPPAFGKSYLNVLPGLMRQSALEITIEGKTMEERCTLPPAVLLPRDSTGEAAL